MRKKEDISPRLMTNFYLFPMTDVQMKVGKKTRRQNVTTSFEPAENIFSMENFNCEQDKKKEFLIEKSDPIVSVEGG